MFFKAFSHFSFLNKQQQLSLFPLLSKGWNVFWQPRWQRTGRYYILHSPNFWGLQMNRNSKDNKLKYFTLLLYCNLDWGIVLLDDSTLRWWQTHRQTNKHAIGNDPSAGDTASKTQCKQANLFITSHLPVCDAKIQYSPDFGRPARLLTINTSSWKGENHWDQLGHK